MKELIIRDDVEQAEGGFPFPHLLALPFFADMRTAYRRTPEVGWSVGRRNYLVLLQDIREINEHDRQHAMSYAKRFRTAGPDKRNSDAVFAEVIVYHYYIRLVHEGLIGAIELQPDEADVIVVRHDGSRAYLEVFCVMPDFKTPAKPDESVVQDVKTHTQAALASIRQKLLHKIQKQGQMGTERDNFAVIELNDSRIANDFTILSSLSSGYKIHINIETRKSTGEGYDWSRSVFDDDSTRFLKGIIYFPVGIYEARKFVFNPFFGQGVEQQGGGYSPPAARSSKPTP